MRVTGEKREQKVVEIPEEKKEGDRVGAIG